MASSASPFGSNGAPRVGREAGLAVEGEVEDGRLTSSLEEEEEEVGMGGRSVGSGERG